MASERGTLCKQVAFSSVLEVSVVQVEEFQSELDVPSSWCLVHLGVNAQSNVFRLVCACHTYIVPNPALLNICAGVNCVQSNMLSGARCQGIPAIRWPNRCQKPP
jgi:hypothetical protein